MSSGMRGKNMSYIKEIQDCYPELTKSERKMADYILTNRSEVSNKTMNDITAEISVGDATVIRFCKKIGYSGFSDLKIEIAKEDFSKRYEYQSEDMYYDKIFSDSITVLNETYQLIDSNDLKETIQYIAQAENISIFGVGSSGQIGVSFEKMLLRVGLRGKAYHDAHFQSQVASIMSADDVVVAMSLSGRTRDIIDSVRLAKKNGAKIIVLSNTTISPLSKLADVLLQTPVNEFINGESIEGKIAQLSICETIVRGYELAHKADVLEIREKITRSIMDKQVE